MLGNPLIFNFSFMTFVSYFILNKTFSKNLVSKLIEPTVVQIVLQNMQIHRVGLQFKSPVKSC